MSRGIFTDKAYLDLQALDKQHKLYALKLSKVKTKQLVVSNFNIFYKNVQYLQRLKYWYTT